MRLDQGPESIGVIRRDETIQKLSLRHCTTLLDLSSPWAGGGDRRRRPRSPPAPYSWTRTIAVPDTHIPSPRSRPRLTSDEQRSGPRALVPRGVRREVRAEKSDRPVTNYMSRGVIKGIGEGGRSRSCDGEVDPRGIRSAARPTDHPATAWACVAQVGWQWAAGMPGLGHCCQVSAPPCRPAPIAAGRSFLAQPHKEASRASVWTPATEKEERHGPRSGSRPDPT